MPTPSETSGDAEVASSSVLVPDQSDIDDDEDICELCADVQELLSRPHCKSSKLTSVELSREDTLAIYRFLEKPHSHNKNCRFLVERIEDIHLLLRSFVVQVVLPMLDHLVQDCESLLKIRQIDFDSEGDLSDTHSEITNLAELDFSDCGTPRFRGYSLEERIMLITFAAQLLSEDFILYRFSAEIPESETTSSSSQSLETGHKNKMNFYLMLMVKCCLDQKILESICQIFEHHGAPGAIPVKIVHSILRILVEIRKYTLRIYHPIRIKIQEIRNNMITYLCATAEGTDII